VTVRVKHNIATYDLVLCDTDTLGQLAEKLVGLTGVPVSGQKMIASGRQLNNGPNWLGLSLKEAGVKTGSKVMLLGKKYDPEQEEGYKDVLGVEKKSGTVEMKIAKIVNEVDDISKGHLAPSLLPEALGRLSKRCNLLNEESLRLLETLDSISLGEEQLEARVKRKSVVTKINRVMDETDSQLQRIKDVSQLGDR